MNGILGNLQSKKEEILRIEGRVADLKAEVECELKSLERELDAYRTEYMDILGSDPVRSQYAKPEWPGRNDIIHYYKT